jgi:hypothetical protein
MQPTQLGVLNLEANLVRADNSQTLLVDPYTKQDSTGLFSLARSYVVKPEQDMA